eukprot:5764081-Amphidinium_carterae.2
MGFRRSLLLLGCFGAHRPTSSARLSSFAYFCCHFVSSAHTHRLFLETTPLCPELAKPGTL